MKYNVGDRIKRIADGYKSIVPLETEGTVTGVGTPISNMVKVSWDNGREGTYGEYNLDRIAEILTQYKVGDRVSRSPYHTGMCGVMHGQWGRVIDVDAVYVRVLWDNCEHPLNYSRETAVLYLNILRSEEMDFKPRLKSGMVVKSDGGVLGLVVCNTIMWSRDDKYTSVIGLDNTCIVAIYKGISELSGDSFGSWHILPAGLKNLVYPDAAIWKKEEIKTLVLNNEYTAQVEGDIVTVGCQKIPTAKVLELADLIRKK